MDLLLLSLSIQIDYTKGHHEIRSKIARNCMLNTICHHILNVIMNKEEIYEKYHMLFITSLDR